jgi:hypothetical protein
MHTMFLCVLDMGRQHLRASIPAVAFTKQLLVCCTAILIEPLSPLNLLCCQSLQLQLEEHTRHASAHKPPPPPVCCYWHAHQLVP